MRNLTKILMAMAVSLSIVGCADKQETCFDWQQQANESHAKILESIQQLGNDYTVHARNILQGETQWNTRKNIPEEWCAGFWPGVLWYDYALSGDSTVRKAAEGWTEALHDFAYQPAYDHDLGFEMIGSYLNGYRLTQREDYKQVLLAAADTLATLFNPAVGTILSWPRHVKDYKGHNTIMDNMINLELLLWASQNGGADSLRSIAIAHADTTMRYHFREDGSSYHVAVYDTITGQHLYNCTHQGAKDESMWARGQSWAIYGYTMMYQYTGEQKYLDFARKVTDVYLSQLPEDGIPYWDFSRQDYRDVSAACVVASTLIDLSAFVGDKQGERYMNQALHMLQRASKEPYWSGKTNSALLLHSVGNLPAGSEIDASIVYADYYYLEALVKLQRRGK